MDRTVIHQPAAGTSEPYAVERSSARVANDQVVVGHIPALRPGFQPRPALMAQLNRASQRPPAVLTGIGGAGKTQLAAAYARAKVADSWRLVAWVNARDGETLMTGLAAVAEAAGLPADGSGRARLTRARRSGTGWRLTGVVACWFSTVWPILACCGRSFRPPGRPRY